MHSLLSYFGAILLSLSSTALVEVEAFSGSIISHHQQRYPDSTVRATTTQSTQLYNHLPDRRQIFQSFIATPTLAFLINFPSHQSAWAASSVSDNTNKGPTPEELSRIQEGYRSITNLLNNFEKETTVCKENGGECKRDADAVRRVLGLRSTKDPLFQIEKVFAKVKNIDDIDFEQLEIFFQATEDWNTAVNMSNSMAFISQFGEYNPGGGKDEVKKYLEESRKQVVLAQKALKDILNVLHLSE